MASPRKPAKQSSGWGGFLQQAVASVESRLDTILADDSDSANQAIVSVPPTKENVASRRPTIESGELSRSSSGARRNDRLQERLARALVKKKGELQDESPSTFPVASTLDEPGVEEPSTAVYSKDVGSFITNLPNSSTLPLEGLHEPGESEPVVSRSIDHQKSESASDRTPLDKTTLNDPVLHGRARSEETNENPETGKPPQDEDTASLPKSVEADMDSDIWRRKIQEELHPYIEKIDALQAKLQYLSKEVAVASKQASSTAGGNIEKKIFEKDERIALLMMEGEKLSKIEMKHLSIIKQLRQQAAAGSKDQLSLKHRAEEAEKRLANMEERAARAEQENKSSSASARDLTLFNKEKSALNATIAEIRGDLARQTRRAEAAERKLQEEQEARNKAHDEELHDAISNAQTEHKSSDAKLRREIEELSASLARERELSRTMENEMLSEQAALEGKLESVRARAEEVSSNNHGEGQAKLLRQIETLQSQYTVASQNWQGIEGSLLSRIAAVEKERADLLKQEADLRKKLRDTALKAKKVDEEHKIDTDRIAELERSLAETQAELQRMVQHTKERDDRLLGSEQRLKEEQARFEKELARRVEEERAKPAAALSANANRTESPIALIRRTPAMDISHAMSPTHSRKPSVFPHSNADSNTPPRQNSLASFRPSTNGTVIGTPSVHSIDPDEYFAGVPPTPASPAPQSRGVNDLISTSTVGAGPSVQLVERMSATVRRLETEKAASKDELTRLTAQRDEARQEIVTSMREVESKRAIESRLDQLQKDHEDISERYQTTLELLGEKSEQVEELKADVADVKQMYRDLVEKTLK